MKEIALALIALTSPVWVVYSVVMYIRWKEYREEKRKTVSEVKVSPEFIERLKNNGRS